jgi:hypothetical protein
MLNVKYQKATKGDWAMAKVRKSKFKVFLLPTGGVRGGLLTAVLAYTSRLQ